MHQHHPYRISNEIRHQCQLRQLHLGDAARGGSRLPQQERRRQHQRVSVREEDRVFRRVDRSTCRARNNSSSSHVCRGR